MNDSTHIGAVVLLSGGMDSTACALLAHRMYGDRLRAFAVDYGQPHARELYHARKLAERLKIEIEVAVIADAVRTIVPASMRTATTAAASLVPGRNPIFIALAAPRAATWFPDAPQIELWMGATYDDRDYPDCRPETIDAASALWTAALARPVRVFAPFVNMTKRQLVTLIAHDPAPIGGLTSAEHLSRSWSCYGPTIRREPCGSCRACVVRRDALEAAGVEDHPESMRVTGGDPHRERK